MNQDLKACIDECQACQRTCLETINHCLKAGGDHAAAEHIRLLMDCAQICQTSADFMVRDSDLHPLVCETCAEVCQQCFEDCDQFAKDAQMQACAATCKRCAESCLQMTQ